MAKFSSRKFILCLLVTLAAGVLRYFDKIGAAHVTTVYILMASAYIGATLAQDMLKKAPSDLNLLDRVSTLPFVMSVILVGASVALQAVVKLDGTQFVAIVSAVVGAYVTSNVLTKNATSADTTGGQTSGS
jgi:hypothetical protein